MLRLGAERDELGVVNDQLGAPTSAKGIAACCLTIANAIAERDDKDIPWGIYHYCGAPHTHWFGFAEYIFATAVRLNILDKAPKLNPISSDKFPTPAKRPKNSQLNCFKVFSSFEIHPDDWRASLDSVLKSIA
jgi:dTDP-4-dehydrorhamnose reductase